MSNGLTPWLLKTPLTPNQVTFLSAFCGILAGIFFARGTHHHALWAAFFYALSCVLDNCDGEIARAKNLRSKLGGWLDIVADFATDVSLFVGVAFGILAQNQNPVFSVPIALGLCLSGGFLHLSLVVLEKLRGFGPAVFNAPNPDWEKRKNIIFKMFDALREGEASWLVVALAVTHNADWILWFGSIYMQILWVSALFINFKFIFRARKK